VGKRHGSNVGDSLVDPDQTDWKPQGLTRAHCRSEPRATEGGVVESEGAKSRTHKEGGALEVDKVRRVLRVRETWGNTRSRGRCAVARSTLLCKGEVSTREQSDFLQLVQ